MKHRLLAFLTLAAILPILPSQRAFAASGREGAGSALKVLAVETFLADIAQNVAGNRLKVAALLPAAADPHSFDPSPSDVIKVADSDVVIVNGAGFEEFLDRLLQNAGGAHRVIVASAGLTSRTQQEGEGEEIEKEAEHHGHRGGEGNRGSDDRGRSGRHREDSSRNEAEHGRERHHSGHRHQHHEGDPHFWLAPQNVIRYVENIRNGLSQADPEGTTIYAANADAYVAQLRELDRWIEDQVKQIPVERRLLVTNHESLGYFADRYGFKIIGTIVPGVSTDASPSAQQLARLIDRIKATGTRAIFLETGTNPQLPREVARETGVKVVAELYTHSSTEPDGPAPSYIAMMKYDTMAVVNALK